jgi:hypothetical protein
VAGGWHDLASELPQEKAGAVEVAFGQSFGARPFNRAPMQQIVRLQMKGALEEIARRMLHHSTGKEAEHYPGDDFAIMGRKEQLPITPGREELFLCADG